MAKHIALITVVYKNYDVLQDLIASLEKQNDSNFILYIVDTSPTVQSISYPQIKIVHIPMQNHGYAGGINKGLQMAIQDGEQLFVTINSDTYVKEDFIAQVRTALDQHRSTIIGGKIYYANGYEYHKDKYHETDIGKVLWFAGGYIDWNHTSIHHRGVDEVDIGQFNDIEKVQFITGCFMCFDFTVVQKVGMWNESYGMYYEDADYCVRAARIGIPLLYDPHIVLWHKNAQSTGGSGSLTQQKYQEKSQLLFSFRFAPIRTTIHICLNILKKKFRRIAK